MHMMTHQLLQSGLYIITNHALPDQDMISITKAALAAGTSIVQLRLKNRDLKKEATLTLAYKLLTLCRDYQALFIINDNPEFANFIGADGVHLGKNDSGIQHARDILGDQSIIGVSCYNSLELALQAQAQGADYIAFGRFFNSASKPQATPANIGLLSKARDMITIPIVAIGGITPQNGRQLVAAGADYLAVINGIYGQQDPYAAACNYLGIFNTKTIKQPQ